MNAKEKVSNRWMKELKDWTLSLGIAIAVSLLIQNYVYAQVEVQKISMQNTLVDGQRLIEDRWSYRFHTPKQGDIVIIDGPEYETRIVKRIAALPGQVIDFRDGAVFVDDVRLDESYAKGNTYTGPFAVPYKVPPEHVFVLGDNREYSIDSRHFGPVSMDSLEGKAVWRIWPLGQFGALK